MKCLKCGTVFDEGIFCPECGEKIEDVEEVSTPAENSLEKTILEHEEKLAREKTEQDRIALDKAEKEAEVLRNKLELAKLEKEKEEKEAAERRQLVEEQRERQEAEARARQEAEAARVAKANWKKEHPEEYQAKLSKIWGILSLCTLGALFIPEILGLIYSRKGVLNGKMLPDAKIGFKCSLIATAIAVTLMVIGAFA